MIWKQLPNERLGIINLEANCMHDFCYVSKKEASPVKATLLDIIHEVQDIVRDDFTFQFTFIGSSSRNMITYDRKSNIGFDFDVNIEVNDDDENYEPKEIRTIIRKALDRVARQYGYDYCEESTRVLTIKMKDRLNSMVVHNCDFAIVNNCNNGEQQYIRYNKENQSYTWEYQGASFQTLPDKIAWLKENGYWGNLRAYYITKKNTNSNPQKHSRSIYAEAITEMCQKLGYFDD